MTAETSKPSTARKLRAIVVALRNEYLSPEVAPWVLAYSGGKDSTLLLQAVWQAIAELPAEQRQRQVHVVANDTLVESPMVREHMHESIDHIDHAAREQAMPITTQISTPYLNQTFWVNVIGRGYIPPTRNFRWCTDRMKIQPTNLIIHKITKDHGRSLLLIGTRRAESSRRRQNMDKFGVEAAKTNPHSTIDKCGIMAPLADLEDNEVWAILTQRPAPWGGDHRRLITIYRNAGGGECPLILTKADAPSCGTTSPRFGCWTCTVVKKDRSMLGTITAGDPESEKLIKMADFRDYIINLREDPNTRWPFRRNGITKFKENRRVMGPFKIRVRQEILNRLRQLETETKQHFLTDGEEALIRQLWREDQVNDERAEATKQ